MSGSEGEAAVSAFAYVCPGFLIPRFHRDASFWRISDVRDLRSMA